jgi:hypothetical protein
VRKFVLVILVFTACGLVWFEVAGHKHQAPGAVSSNHAGRAVVTEHKRRANAPEVAKADAPSNLSLQEFNRRFDLNSVDEMNFWSELRKVRRDLMEEKGNRAQVAAFDGKVLKVIIPALSVQTGRLESAILPHLQAALGSQKAARIWADDAGRKTVLNRVWDDMLKCDAIYTFTKVRDENDPARNGSLGHAVFDLSVVFDPGTSGAVAFPNSDGNLLQGFTYSQAGEYDFGWNAMSKAPAGYFRSEPILGVASRPPPTVFAVGDVDTGTVEIWNNRHPGSKDTLKDGKLVEGVGDSSGSK